MEVDDSDDLILLDSGADSNVFEVLRKDVISMSSARDSIVNDQPHHGLQGVISPLNFKLRSDVLS